MIEIKEKCLREIALNRRLRFVAVCFNLYFADTKKGLKKHSRYVIINKMNKNSTKKDYWRELNAESFDSAEICLFGIAADEHCSVGKGTASAPSVMRECSAFLPPYTVGGKKIPPILCDMGDVEGYDYAEVEKRMERALGKKLTVMLGGDHSVSILSQKAFRKLVGGRLGIVHIDAHADICDVYDGTEFSHACVLRRALDNGFREEDITLVGIRSYEGQEAEFLSSSRVKVYGASEFSASVAEEIIEKYRDFDGIYVSFDIDAVDPAYAPGTGTPEAFGLHSAEVLKLLTALFGNLPVKMFDLVEVSPPLDVNNVTSWLALKYLLEIFGTVSSDRK